MNPMTNVKNIQKLNERMLEMGVADNVSWHKQYKDSAYVFIGGLPYDLTEGDILCVFSQYGEIVNINLVRDKKTGKQKGFCFLCYEDQRSTILAVDNFNGIKLGGRTIRVDHCADYRRPKGDEKDEDGNKKEIIEEGCAPKTPSPPPSEDEEEFQEPVQKKKKSKKEKKHKKDKEKKLKKKEYSSESDSDHHQNVKKYPGNNGKMKEITSQSSTSPVKESRTAKDNNKKSNDRGDRIREWDYGKRTRDNTHDPSPPRVRKRDFEDANRARDYSHDGSPPRMRKKEWDDQKRTKNESSYPPDERKQRSYEFQNRQYRSDDKDRSHYNRDEPDDRRDDGYGRSRRGDGYDERERDRSERKGNRR